MKTLHRGGAMCGAAQLLIELSQQVAVQRQLGYRTDPDTDKGQHHDLSYQQPQPKRPGAPHLSASAANHEPPVGASQLSVHRKGARADKKPARPL